MRLLRARFENFRLLRDLDLDFSADPTRKLTVVRAANETGKTTILHGLQWGLYGEEALPDGGGGFRLHPIDWPKSGSQRVPMSVMIEFEVVKYNKVAGHLRESRKRYRIIRSAFEEIQGTEFHRTAPTVKLFALNDSGATPIDAPEAAIDEELPHELRDVFFTDGDRALSFIESIVAVSTKRERVERAIRSLLGLSVIEEAKKHVKKAAADINRQARAVGGGTELTDAASKLDTINQDLIKLEAGYKDAHGQFVAFDEKLGEVDKKIQEALKKGDREKLGRDLEAARKTIARLDERIAAANKEHSQLFRNEALARDILEPAFRKAFKKLKDLHDKGKIPNTTIPVLEERLTQGVCICGETLEDDKSDGSKRLQHIQDLIDASRKADEVQATVTDLYYGSRSLEQRSDTDQGRWMALLAKVVKDREGLQALRDEEGRKLKSLEVQLDALPDIDIQSLRDVARDYSEQRDRFNVTQTRIETQMDNLKKERTRLEALRDKLLRQQKKGARIISELEVAKDVQDVLERAYHRITTEELTKVSDLMNKMFLEMIGADPEQGAIIRKAEISKEFDIIVYGPEGRTLNPDRDLNGASRRALTISFILALTKVSEVEAPNVIDTPLGMTSGYVKRSILKTAIRESSQLILFLTHDEIKGCEEIINDYAGAVYTLTNPAHYPKMLVHDPKSKDLKALRCSCNHLKQCALCERRLDSEPASSMAV